MLSVIYCIAVIAFGVGVLGAIIFFFKFDGDRTKLKYKKIGWFLVFIAIVGLFTAFTIGANEEKVIRHESEKYNLIALQDTYDEDMDIQLQLFALEVDKQEKTFYRFYYQEENGDIHFKEMDVSDVVLTYTDGEAYYEVITTTTTSNVCRHEEVTYTHKLHIPTGSISAGIEIDMQD